MKAFKVNTKTNELFKAARKAFPNSKSIKIKSGKIYSTTS